MFEESGWVNKIITAGIIGMVGWTLLTVNSLDKNMAVMQTKLNTLELVFEKGTADRYTRSEASSDRALLEQRLSRLEEWNQRLSDRINSAETKIDTHQATHK